MYIFIKKEAIRIKSLFSGKYYMFRDITLFRTRVGFELQSDGFLINVAYFTLADEINNNRIYYIYIYDNFCRKHCPIVLLLSSMSELKA